MQKDDMKNMCVLVMIFSLITIFGCQSPSQVPFPNLEEITIDQEVAELLEIRINRHNDSEADEAHKKLVAMGTKAVPTLIYFTKKAANFDPMILDPEENTDYGWELRRPIQVLVDIGDRRAIPVISNLLKYDNKPMRMHHHLAVLLCHGSDEQIIKDTNSDDPNVAAEAKRILNYPEHYEYYKKKYRQK